MVGGGKVDFEDIEQQLAALPLEEQVQVLQGLLAAVVRRAATQQTKGQPDVQPHTLVKHELDALTYRITGCAMAVHRQLGASLRKVNYQRALETAFEQAGLAYRPQQKIAVYEKLNRQRLLGYYIPDFIVEDVVVLEIKALGRLDNAHVAQVISYLAVTGCSVGLLFNFGERTLRWRRIFPPSDLQAYRVNGHWLWNPFAKDAAANGFLQAD